MELYLDLQHGGSASLATRTGACLVFLSYFFASRKQRKLKLIEIYPCTHTYLLLSIFATVCLAWAQTLLELLCALDLGILS